MNDTKENLIKEEQSQIILNVRDAQIEQLYRQSWAGIIGIVVVAMTVCIFMQQVVPAWKLFSWLTVLVSLNIARGFLTASFFKVAPKGSDVDRWARWHVATICASGLTWALPPFFLWPENHPDYYLVWALCILPLSASAIATYYTWKPSYISFLLISALPVAIRFFIEGGLLYTTLGFLTLFFIAVLLKAGSQIHKVSVATLFTGFHNEALSAHLAAEKEEQERLASQLQKAHDKMHKISLTDELTGLWNRRYLNVTMAKDVAQVLRNYQFRRHQHNDTVSENTDIGFIMVDLDHFKAVNDTYGHSVGDQILVQVCHLLTNSIRATDTTIRWGGEEFLVVSRNTRRKDYTTLLERIRRAVENHEFHIGKEAPLRLTCSMGAATFPFLTTVPEALAWDKVVDVADACLYAAKHSGRNGWVGILATTVMGTEDLTPDLPKNIPHLIREGKLVMQTSREDNVVCWPE